MPKRLTQEEFFNRIPNIIRESCNLNKIVYKGLFHKIIVGTKYGDCLVLPMSLIKGSIPTIKTAVNKTEYILNMIHEQSPEVIISPFTYEGFHQTVIVKTPYGDCRSRLSNLYMGKTPTVQSALNPTQYFINKSKLIHGDRYDYSKTKYKNARTKVTITCKEHGDFKVNPDNHSRRPINCNKCEVERVAMMGDWGWTKTAWRKRGEASSNFDSYKVYLIECYNEEERFLKIGRTFRTTDERNKDIIYKCNVIAICAGESDYIYDFENHLQRKYKQFKYRPLIEFGGQHECFSDKILEFVKEEILNQLKLTT